MHRQWRSRAAAQRYLAELHTTAASGNQSPLFKIGRAYCRKHLPHDRHLGKTLLSINEEFPEDRVALTLHSIVATSYICLFQQSETLEVALRVHLCIQHKEQPLP
jgi:hypothetical protein